MHTMVPEPRWCNGLRRSILVAAFALGGLALSTSASAATTTIQSFDPGSTTLNDTASTPARCTDDNPCWWGRFHYDPTTDTTANRLGIYVGAHVSNFSASGTIQRDSNGQFITHLRDCTGGSSTYNSPAFMLCWLETPTQFVDGADYNLYFQFGPAADGTQKQSTSVGSSADPTPLSDTKEAQFAPQGGAANCTGNGCQPRFFLYYNDEPPSDLDVDWRSWPDGTTGDQLTLNQTQWILRSSVPSTSTDRVAFELGIYREPGTLVYATTTLYDNWPIGCAANPSYTCRGFRSAPQYVHTTGTYQLYLRGSTSSTTSNFDVVDYEVTASGPQPETCEGGFFTACFWRNLFISLAVPAPDSIGASAWQTAVSSTYEKAPFSYLVQVVDAVQGLDPATTTTDLIVGGNIVVANTNINLSLPLMTSTTPWRDEYNDNVLPLLRLLVVFALVFYIWDRVRGITDEL